ncbi:hypothetical protein V1477_001024 [Vespula maculifrons]|uniref:Uncharacterized protein n=1 Tax=Vespula maculifrons TaxID=7453 RepID=A0ABD2D0N3_VESMC
MQLSMFKSKDIELFHVIQFLKRFVQSFTCIKTVEQFESKDQKQILLNDIPDTLDFTKNKNTRTNKLNSDQKKSLNTVR